MRYSQLIAMLFIAAFLGSASTTQAASAVEKKALNQSFSTIDGKTITLYQFKGKMVLVHFWAAWCPPCIKELPVLLQAAKDNPDIAVIAISVDRNKKDMTDFLAHINNLSMIKNVFFVHDPGNRITVNNVKVFRYPETFIITRDMIIGAHVEGGLDWSRFDFDQ